MYRISWIIFIWLSSYTPLNGEEQKPLSIIIMGYGGRSQWLLMKCLEQNRNIVITAICDDNAKECLNHMQQACNGRYLNLKDTFNTAIANVQVYPDSYEGMYLMFHKHPNVDMIWITSRNDRHFDHLTNTLHYSTCPKIFMEKPLFRTFDEFKAFDWNLIDREILIGLTLRYSSMAVIVAQQLQANQQQLGSLQKIKAWERLSFSHALTSFVLAERRYRSRWGGLLLEKSIHDVDLALFFISSMGLHPSRVVLDTFTENKFFTRSNEQEILKYCGGNNELRRRVAETLQNYPLDDNFYGSDLIPDYHRISAHLFVDGHEPILFEVETDMSAYRPTMERGTLLTFEFGQVLVDVMASRMVITLNDGNTSTYDLKTNYGGHANGDRFVIDAILNKTIIDDHCRTTILDPIVQLANIIALVSEEQAIHRYGTQEIFFENKSWILKNTIFQK